MFAADVNNTTTVFPVNINLVILIDDSKSMLTNDSIELRISATKSLIDIVKETTSKTEGLNYSIKIVTFGVNQNAIRQLNGLKNEFHVTTITPKELPKSDFRPVLQHALNEFQATSLKSGDMRAVILVTDGRPQLTDISLTTREVLDYFNASTFTNIRDQFKRRGIELFVLGIGDKKIAMTANNGWY
ncbi:MAG: VWA domain-containing protein [Deltaproteobacteria bacterium]|nr:VWA domain-containing protein [Deltaproteobacteria bacterium]